EYALHGLGVGAFDASRLHAVLAVGGVNGGVVNGERLDRQREDAVFVGGRDFGGARKAWTKLAGWAVERDHDFEILRFFGAGGGLGGGNAGGAEQRLVADKCDVTLENFIGQGIHSDVGGLADGDVDDIRFVHFHFGRDHTHVSQGHEGGALGVLDAFDHGFAFTDRLVSDDSIERSNGDRTVEEVLVGAQVRLLG